MRAYSQDLRDRVLGALERGERPSAIARRYEVSRMWVYRVRDRFEKEGERSSRQQGGKRISRLAPVEGMIRDWIKADPDLTLVQMCERLGEHGISIKPSALWHQLNKWRLSFKKKTLHASEQEREDVQQARASWIQQQARLDARRLVFLDETWSSTCMTPLRGRAPHGHWKTSTFIAALRCDALTAPMVTDGPINGAVFLAWVKTFRCPTLRPGDIVIADNLSSHKVAGVREAIEGVGASIRYLPPYSPDLNPIEKLFAKFKALLRRAGERTVGALWQRMGQLVDLFSAQECANYFKSAGYVMN
ncbi:IS630 family transposase [Neisseria shayeganii]|uniref:IS630 family transposase n=1 Tax=Neisseria shayeganii TaxID=607712 RepID=A0A7D7RW42_9NEIS|nr:IS630 family transposase [Neisseria shayeganii]